MAKTMKGCSIAWLQPQTYICVPQQEVLGTTVPIRDSREYIRVFFQIIMCNSFLRFTKLS